LFKKKIKFGFFIKDLNFEKFPKIHFSTLALKKGVEGGKKKVFDKKYMCTKNEVSRSKNVEVSLCWVYPPRGGHYLWMGCLWMGWVMFPVFCTH